MRIKPLATCLLLAGVLTPPIPAFALGLGKLTLLSGLGQPLSAQIELTSAQRDEVDSLRARIVDVSVYRDNNVPYSSVLARARVTLEQGPNSVPYLRVTTAQPVNDPFLDLIVEINWATGRVVRDYTFLLDPPGSGEMQAVEPARPIAQAGRAREARSASPPAAPASSAGGAGSAQAVTGAAAAPAAAPAPAPARSSGGGDTYTVKRGDTLSKIARDYKPQNVSLEQVLVALFRSNESAFDGGNMNRLRTGQILNIPSRDQLGAVSPDEAATVVKVQADDWRTYRDRIAATTPTIDTTPSRASAAGKIGTAVEEQTVPAQAGKDQLRVSREAGKGAGAGAGQAENAAAKEKALREANARIAELEKTVRDLQKAAELKNQTLAELQARAEAPKGAAPAAPPTAMAPQQPATPQPAAAVPGQAPAAATAPAAPPPQPAAAPQATAPQAKAPEGKPAPEAATPQAKGPEAKAPETKREAPAAAPKPQPAPAPVKAPAPAKAPEPSLIDDVLGSTPTWAIGGGALVVLAGIAGILAARRRRAPTKFEDSIISGTDIKTNTVFGSTGGGVVNTGDNSLASDFSREGLGSIDTDEVDPIAEAEVYLAYGRDAQAEEILKDALKKDPQRQEIYLKLLEIHAQHNKPSAFETVASELYSVSGGQGDVWQKARALGRQLDPSNPLFSEGAAESAPGAPAAPTTQQAPVSASMQVFSVPPALTPEPHTTSALDLSLDEEMSVPNASAMAQPKTPASILAGAEQEVAKSSRVAAEVAKGAALAGAATAAGTAALDSGAGVRQAGAPHESVSFEPESVPKFDLDFQLEEPSISAPGKAGPAPKPAAPEPALAVEGASTPAPQLIRPAAAIELDKLDLAFDPQRSTFEDPTPSVLDGQWHDAATKLDLAKAYQEMGDVEGAREILQEVVHEGDDQQKAEAQALLAKLAS